MTNNIYFFCLICCAACGMLFIFLAFLKKFNIFFITMNCVFGIAIIVSVMLLSFFLRDQGNEPETVYVSSKVVYVYDGKSSFPSTHVGRIIVKDDAGNSFILIFYDSNGNEIDRKKVDGNRIYMVARNK